MTKKQDEGRPREFSEEKAWREVVDYTQKAGRAAGHEAARKSYMQGSATPLVTQVIAIADNAQGNAAKLPPGAVHEETRLRIAVYAMRYLSFTLMGDTEQATTWVVHFVRELHQLSRAMLKNNVQGDLLEAALHYGFGVPKFLEGYAEMLKRLAAAESEKTNVKH